VTGGIPGPFDGDFDHTVRHLTAIFDDFTGTRDAGRLAVSATPPGNDPARRRSRLGGGTT
jgi:hypothetical protein